MPPPSTPTAFPRLRTLVTVAIVAGLLDLLLHAGLAAST
jgi:hypothetical protein